MNYLRRSPAGETLRKIRFLTFTLVLCVVVFGSAPPALSQTPGPVNSAEEPVSRAELRELLIQMTELLNRHGKNTEAATKLRQRIDSLDAQSFEYLYQASNNWGRLRTAVALMSAGEASGKKSSAEVSQLKTGGGEVQPLSSSAGLPADLFDAVYPTGSNYDTFRATLPDLGAMSDTAGSVPGLEDERCDSNFEAGVAIASSTFAFANIIAENACEVLPELADIPCWITNGLIQALAEANETVAAQCEIVDESVDATEIEAGYENTVAIYKNLDAHHLALLSHDADVKTAITNAQTAINTNTNTTASSNTTAITNVITASKNEIITNDNANRTTIVNNDNSNKTAIITNDNDNKTAIVNNDNANKTAIIANDNANKDLLLRAHIEEDLAKADNATPVAWFLTPTAQGGHLNLVQTIVTQTLANIVAAGGSIGDAQSFLNLANTQKAAGQFKDAYKNYRKAYKAAAN